jgi:hypothetical protein
VGEESQEIVRALELFNKYVSKDGPLGVSIDIEHLHGHTHDVNGKAPKSHVVLDDEGHHWVIKNLVHWKFKSLC